MLNSPSCTCWCNVERNRKQTEPETAPLCETMNWSREMVSSFSFSWWESSIVPKRHQMNTRVQRSVRGLTRVTTCLHSHSDGGHRFAKTYERLRGRVLSWWQDQKWFEEIQFYWNVWTCKVFNHLGFHYFASKPFFLTSCNDRQLVVVFDEMQELYFRVFFSFAVFYRPGLSRIGKLFHRTKLSLYFLIHGIM